MSRVRVIFVTLVLVSATLIGWVLVPPPVPARANTCNGACYGNFSACSSSDYDPCTPKCRSSEAVYPACSTYGTSYIYDDTIVEDPDTDGDEEIGPPRFDPCYTTYPCTDGGGPYANRKCFFGFFGGSASCAFTSNVTCRLCGHGTADPHHYPSCTTKGCPGEGGVNIQRLLHQLP